MKYVDKDKQKAYQKAYQKEYRAKNKPRLAELQKEWKERPGNRERHLSVSASWMEKNGNFNKPDSSKPWTHREHILVNERENGKYKYRILDLCKVIDRSYGAIQCMRASMNTYNKEGER